MRVGMNMDSWMDTDEPQKRCCALLGRRCSFDSFVDEMYCTGMLGESIGGACFPKMWVGILGPWHCLPDGPGGP